MPKSGTILDIAAQPAKIWPIGVRQCILRVNWVRLPPGTAFLQAFGAIRQWVKEIAKIGAVLGIAPQPDEVWQNGWYH